MAFRVPAQAPYHQVSYSRTEKPSTLEIPPAPQQQQDDETREWVLFSPSQDHSATRSLTSSTSRTPRTAALSQWSDFGPLESGNRSIEEDHDNNDSLDEALEDELDSLDDGLHAFRESSLATLPPGGLDHSHPVLPTHDGLGSFHFSGQDVQERLWQHERLNPRRTQAPLHPSPSLEQSHQEVVAKLENDEVEWDRRQRIEKWRMEQSRVLLREIERETTRLQRRNSRASRTSDRASALRTGTDVMGSISETRGLSDTSSSHTETSSTAGNSDPDISFWRRITRKVIRDLIGIDNTLLSVILGESLPATDQDSLNKSDVRETSGTDREVIDPNRDDGAALWQARLLQRIARELGVLVHQLFESPGAFSSYPRASQSISDRSTGGPFSPLENEVPSKLLSQSPHPDHSVAGLSSNLSLHFSPTLRGLVGDENAAHWGIEDHSVQTAATNPTTGLGTSAEHSAPDEHFSELANLQREHEYWERDLDVSMVFRYLRNRFGPGEKNNLNPASGRHTTPTQCPQDLSRRAAIIRHHHPLVARAHARSQAQLQRQLKVHTQSSSGGISAAASPSSPIARYRFRRRSSSCASQSTKTTNRTLAGVGSNSSRNYWDVSGSVGSNSPVSVGGAAGLGAWGDM